MQPARLDLADLDSLQTDADYDLDLDTEECAIVRTVIASRSPDAAPTREARPTAGPVRRRSSLAPPR